MGADEPTSPGRPRPWPGRSAIWDGPGLVACAISAVDIALWDLQSPHPRRWRSTDLFGRARHRCPSTAAGVHHLRRRRPPSPNSRLGREGGSPGQDQDRRVLGYRPRAGPAPGGLARRVIGDAELYVDANGGYTVKQAIRLGRDNVRGIRRHLVRRAGLLRRPGRDSTRSASSFDGDVAAGEYGYTLGYFARMLEAGAVDCLQADVTRCGGYTVWLRTAALAEAHHVEISGHCAPNLHAPVAAAVPNLRHVEYFYDHHRIETMLFDGCAPPHRRQHDPRLLAAGPRVVAATRPKPPATGWPERRVRVIVVGAKTGRCESLGASPAATDHPRGQPHRGPREPTNPPVLTRDPDRTSKGGSAR